MEKKRSIFIKRVMAWILTLALVISMLASHTVFADDENAVQKKDFSGYITGNRLENEEGKILGGGKGESVNLSDTLNLQYDYAITDSISVEDIYILPTPSGVDIGHTASGSAIRSDSGEIGTLYGDSDTPYYIRFSSDVTGTQDEPVTGTVDLSCAIAPAAVQNGTVKIDLIKGQTIELSVLGTNAGFDIMPETRNITGSGEFFTNPPTFATMEDAQLVVKKNGIYVPVSSGQQKTTLFFGDELAIRYNWNISEVDRLAYIIAQGGTFADKLLKGSTFSLPKITHTIPAAGDNSQTSAEISVTIDSASTKLGTLFWDAGTGETSFRLDMDIEAGVADITGGFFEYYCKLDQQSVGDIAEEITVTVGDTDYKIIIGDNKKVETSLKKSGTNKDGIMTWEAEITAGTVVKTGANITPGISSGSDSTSAIIKEQSHFKDDLPVGLTYITDSFEYSEDNKKTWKKAASPDTEVTFTPDMSADSGSLDWIMPDLEIGKKLYIRYKTAFSDQTVENQVSQKDYINQASIELKESKTLSATATVSADGSGSNAKWIQKVPEGEFNPATKKMKWKLTINGNARNIENVKIYDIMSKSQAIDGDVIFTGSDRIPRTVTARILEKQEATNKWTTAKSKIDPSAVGGSTGVTQSDINDQNYNIVELDLSSIPTTAITKDAVITYSTKLTTAFDSDQNATGDRHFYNGVWLECDWLYFVGVGNFKQNYATPGVGKPFKVWALDIQKNFVKYNRSNQHITWKVTINGDHFDMQDMTVIDTIGADQSYVQDSIKNGKYISEHNITTTAPPNDIIATPNQGGTVTFGFQTYKDSTNPSLPLLYDFGKNKIEFEFDTIVTKADDYAMGGNTPIEKNAYYTNLVTLGGEINGQNLSLTASATAKIKSQVLQKEVSLYNYKDHTMTWTVTVNHNKMPMTNVSVEDIIPEGTYLLKDSLKFTTNPNNIPLQYTYQAKNGTPVAETDAQADKKLIITLGDIDETLVLTYKTKVDVDYDTAQYTSFLEDNDQNGKVFKNKVTLKRDTYQDVSANVSCTVKNPMIKKSGSTPGKVNEQDSIAYEITVNPNSAALPTDAQLNYIYDKLPNNLVLDETSITVQECSMGDTPGEIVYHDVADGELIGIKQAVGTKPGDGIGTVAPNQYIYTYNEATNEFFVYLPAGEAKPYRLSFQTFVVSLQNTNGTNNSIENKASFASLTGGSSNDEKVIVKVSLKVAGGASANSRTGNVTFVKTDSLGNPLAGAVFTLEPEGTSGNTKVDTVTSSDELGKEGVAEFPAKSLGNYILKEIKAPDGYMIDNREYKVAIGKMLNAQNKIEPFYTIKLGDDLLTSGNDSAKIVNHTLGEITVKKVAEDNQTLLSNAMFKIEKKDDAAFAERTAKTGAAGTCTFDGLEAGTYIITETLAPEGYQIDVASKEVTIDGPGSANFTSPMKKEVMFVNYICGNIIIKKTAADTKQPLSGATFALYTVDVSGNKTQLGDPQVTDADGKITFRNLEYGQYEIAETLAAPGYILNTKTESVEVKKGDAIKTLNFENEPYGKIIVRKTATDTKQPLSGATFALYTVDVSGNKTQLGDPQVTDADGKITFRNLEYGQYEIVETLAAPGYILNTKTEVVDIQKGDVIQTVDVENEPYGKITVQKTNATTGEQIPDAEFALMSGTTILKTGVTDENGSLTFTDVSDGTYELLETKPADGFMPNTKTYTVTVDRVKLHPVIPVQNQHYGILNLIKVESGTESKKLKDVEFALYKVESSPLPAETPSEAGKPTVAPDAVPISVKTTDENGTLTFEHLTYGDYILRETKPARGYVLNEYPLDKITISQEKYHFEFTIENEKEKTKPDGGGSGGGTPDVLLPTPYPSISPSPSVSPAPSVTLAATNSPKPQKTIQPSSPAVRKPNIPSDPSNPLNPDDMELDLTDPDVPTGYSSPIIPGEPAGIEIGDEDVARGALEPEEETSVPKPEEDLSLGDMDPPAGYKLPQTGERSGADTLVLIGICLVLIGGAFLGINKLKTKRKE